MVRHFGDCEVNNMQPVNSENVRSSGPFIRKAREKSYIYLLETVTIKPSIYLIFLDVNRLNHLYINLPKSVIAVVILEVY